MHIGDGADERGSAHQLYGRRQDRTEHGGWRQEDHLEYGGAFSELSSRGHFEMKDGDD